MIDAHKEIFRILDDYCAMRGDPVKNSGEIRFISGPSKSEKDFLKDAQKKLTLEFTATRRVILYEHLDRSYFCLIGFDGAEEFSTLKEESLNGGYFSAIIADLKPKPIGSTSEIRNIVEAQDSSIGAGYKGHSHDLIGSLFPTVKVFSGFAVSNDESYRIFFRFCLLECRYGDYWIDGNLAEALIQLCDVDALQIPYQTLCRSIFDADPAALYLALYRCIEALYALKTTSKLAGELGISKKWNEVCIILEQRLGWRAPEASSLNDLLKLGDEKYLLEILISLNMPDPAAGANLANFSGKQIYKLRNALVHFRPVHHKSEFERIDWNRICVALAFLVKNIYERIFIEIDEESAVEIEDTNDA